MNFERPATPQTASPPAPSLHYAVAALGPITLAALSVSPFSISVTICLPRSSFFSDFLALQAFFTQLFQELPVSPDWLKQTLTVFCYLIQLCLFSFHRPWSMRSIRCPGRHEAAPSVTHLGFQTPRITHGVQTLNKVLLKSSPTPVQTWWFCIYLDWLV